MRCRYLPKTLFEDGEGNNHNNNDDDDDDDDISMLIVGKSEAQETNAQVSRALYNLAINVRWPSPPQPCNKRQVGDYTYLNCYDTLSPRLVHNRMLP